MNRRTTLPPQLAPILAGEDSTRQFKSNIHNPESLAAEMAAFANAEGGTIFIGVNDRCQAYGVASDDVSRINQLISNTASQGIRSPLVVQTENVSVKGGQVVVVLRIGVLNLAGLLLFGEQPERFKPQFVVKAVSYPGSQIHASIYEDAEDFSGPLTRVFEGALAFVLRNLRKVQAGRGINSLGVPEIPPVVFEELLVNALVHRDYLIDASIRLFVFNDRVEIISPGHLPNNLTVEKIRVGNSNLRNPILASHSAKGLLPYRGLGSGVPRAVESWPEIEFRDDRDGNLFVATVERLLVASEKTREKSSEKTLPVREETREKPAKTGLSVGENPIEQNGSEKTDVSGVNIGDIEPESAAASDKSSEKTRKKSSEKTLPTREKTAKTGENVGENAIDRESSEKTLISRDNIERTEPERAATSEKSSEKTREKAPELGVSVGENGTKQVASEKKRLTGEKTREKLLDLIRSNPEVTTAQLAQSIGITAKGVEWQVRLLRSNGRLRRIGPDKGGRWEVIE